MQTRSREYFFRTRSSLSLLNYISDDSDLRHKRRESRIIGKGNKRHKEDFFSNIECF